MKTQPESEMSNFRVQAFLLLGSFRKKLRSSTWKQVLWCWTVIGRGWNFSTRGPGGMAVRQTGLNWSLQTTTLWWRCPRHSCLSPKWESKTAALVLAWKYIAVFQDANHVFSMSVMWVCWVLWAACYSDCWAITGRQFGELLTVTSDQNTGSTLLDSTHCYGCSAVKLERSDTWLILWSEGSPVDQGFESYRFFSSHFK